jgi:hypothetical protein
MGEIKQNIEDSLFSRDSADGEESCYNRLHTDCNSRTKRLHDIAYMSLRVTIESSRQQPENNDGNSSPELGPSWEEVVDNSDDQIVKYWRKVCFNILAKMVLISYILYKKKV